MIVRVQEGSAPNQREGFVALHQRGEGDWVPITGDIEPSADKAVRACVDGVRAQLDGLEHVIAQHVELIHENLERLWDVPGAEDEVRIKNDVCEVDEDGVVNLSAPSQEALERRRLYVERRRMLHAEVDDDVYKALRKALAIRKKREHAAGVMVDYALDRPQELLGIVAERAPEALGRVAEFIARVYRVDRAVSGSRQAPDGRAGP